MVFPSSCMESGAVMHQQVAHQDALGDAHVEAGIAAITSSEVSKSIDSPPSQVGPRSEEAERQKPSPEERRKQLLKAMQEEAQDQMQMLKAPLPVVDWSGVPREVDASRPTLDATSFAAVVRPIVDASSSPVVNAVEEIASEMQPQVVPEPTPILQTPSVHEQPRTAPGHGLKQEHTLMSSASYFSPYTRRMPVSSDASSQQQSSTSQADSSVAIPRAMPDAPFFKPQTAFRSPFPMSRADVLESRLVDVSQDVQHVSAMIAQAAEQRKVHPVGLQQIMEIVRDIRSRSAPLTDVDLERMGWPSELVQRLADMDEGFRSWQHCETLAKTTIAPHDSQPSLSEVVQVLSSVLVMWCRLKPLAEGNLCLDIDLQKRAQTALPLVSVLLDKAFVLAKESMDESALQQLSSLLDRAVQQPGLASLGATDLLAQTLQDLHGEYEKQKERKVMEDTLQASHRKVMMITQQLGAQLTAPETLWQAVTQGNTEIVEAIVYQGGLVSGQTKDQQGHTVFWDAVAFQQPDMGLLLWKHFTPGTPHGIDISETHQRNGNGLLHLISSFKTFTESASDLFVKIFNESTQDSHLHRNARGQTFLHVAAGKLNFWVLKFAAKQHHLVDLFSLLDGAGWSPRRLLEYHFGTWQLAEAPLPNRVRSKILPLPIWCKFPLPESADSAFVDVCLEVCDAASGTNVQFPAHAVLLGAHSPVWHQQLVALGVGRCADGAITLKTLTVDPQICSSAIVLKYVLNFIYKGDDICSFDNSAHLLCQLYSMCTRYELPSPLTLRAQDALLRCLGDPLSASIVSALLRDAKQLKLPSPVRQFLSRLFISQDAVWHAVAAEERASLLSDALSELEPCVLERGIEDPLQATLASEATQVITPIASPYSMSMTMSSFH